ncbi:MAG TPA: DNA polymerase III subunit beta [Candidatus Paceibacterota bacterium]|nr:DNA polymerase III subunit beta [Candidatus Paceibacterota bacterium]
MKIECTKEKLQKAVGKAEKITGKNLTLPILSCLLLKTEGQNVIIKSTNLDLGVELSFGAKVEGEGETAVPASVLNNYLSSAPDTQTVVLSTKEGGLSLSSKEGSTFIKSHPPEEFPLIPAVPKDSVFRIKASDIVQGLRAVWYSSSVSSVKPELASVYIYQSGGSIFFVATDSFRLAEKQIINKSKADFAPILIPYKNISEIIRVLEDTDEEVEVAVTKNQISFSFPGTYLTSRVIEGVFPDYRQIIPKEFTTEATLLKQDLLNTLRLVNIFADKFNQVSFKVSPGKRELEVSSRNSDVGESVEKLGGAMRGEDLEIHFNYKYVADCFQSIPSDSVTLRFTGPHKPLLIGGSGDNSFTYLVMPMNR